MWKALIKIIAPIVRYLCGNFLEGCYRPGAKNLCIIAWKETITAAKGCWLLKRIVGQEQTQKLKPQ